MESQNRHVDQSPLTLSMMYLLFGQLLHQNIFFSQRDDFHILHW
jgi:hypothetical protein